MVVTPELRAQILRLYLAEHWRVGTIARQLRLHRDTVRRVLTISSVLRTPACEPPRLIDLYLPFIKETLTKYPTLAASRLYIMVQERGYGGGSSHFRHLVAPLRPRRVAEAYLRLRTLPAEQAQVDWAHMGHVMVGRAKRPLMAFVMVLSYSRRIFLHFSLNAQMDNFLRGHVLAFDAWGGVPRVILSDNLKSAVLERLGDAIRFNPDYLAFAAHYKFEPRPVAVARGNEKGRVERSIRYIRDNFFAARVFADVADLNAQAKAWTDGPAFERSWPEGEQLTVRQAFDSESPSLMSLPPDVYPVDARVEVTVAKTPYVRFDLNDYSIPHTHVRRTVTVLANAQRVRVFDGATILADHVRSYDKGVQIEITAHVDELIERKRGARQHRATSQLTQTIPAMADFLARAAAKGHHLASMTRVLGQMLAHYGAQAMQEAVAEALRRDVPHHNAVRLALERARQERRDSPLVVPQLSERAQRMDVTVKPHRLDAYDELQASTHQTDESSEGHSTETDEDTQ
jgi:transposase